jgi:hypothetical protein
MPSQAVMAVPASEYQAGTLRVGILNDVNSLGRATLPGCHFHFGGVKRFLRNSAVKRQSPRWIPYRLAHKSLAHSATRLFRIMPRSVPSIPLPSFIRNRAVQQGRSFFRSRNQTLI